MSGVSYIGDIVTVLEHIKIGTNRMIQKYYKSILSLLVLLCTLNLIGQQKNNKGFDEEHSCASHHKTQELFDAHPELQEELNAEADKMLKNGMSDFKNTDCTDIVTIPVVFHYLYDPNNLNAGFDTDNFIINTILSTLNAYFAQEDNADDNLPPAFQGTAANGTCIEFCLAQYDHPTNNNLYGDDLNRDGIKDANGDGRIDEGQYAINRYNITAAQASAFASDPNLESTVQGIAPGWPIHQYMNVYVVPNIGGNVGGYTYLPNSSGTTFNSIYMSYWAIGQNVTLAHEAGHWLGLNHPWGPAADNACGIEDFYLNNGAFPVNDTYPQETNSLGVGGGTCNASSDSQVPMSCGSVDNIFNVMDYGDCTFYFTEDQAGYMYNTVTNLNTAGRSNFGNDIYLQKCQVPPPVADFTVVGNSTICLGQAYNFLDNSTNDPTSWTWNFSGTSLNSPVTVTTQDAFIAPDQTGTLIVSLTVSNVGGFDTYGPITYNVTVLPEGSAGCAPVNNECFGAVDISAAFDAACPTTTNSMGPYSNVGATVEQSDIDLTNYSINLTGSDNNCCTCEIVNGHSGTGLHNSVWFSFTPSTSGLYTLEALAQSSSACGGSLGVRENSQMLIYQSTDGSCNSLSFFDCNEDGPSATFSNFPAGGQWTFNAGTTYYVLVDGYFFNQLEEGTFCMEVTYDDCVDVMGCTNTCATNYDPTATVDDGSCTYPSCDDGCILTVDTYDSTICECVFTPPNVDDGCPLTVDFFDGTNCTINSIPPDVDDGCDLTFDTFDAVNCEIVNVPPNPDDGCPFTVDNFDFVNCQIINTPPACDDGCDLTPDSFDFANCQCESVAPDVDDGCDLTTDNFNFVACQIINIPPDPDDGCPLTLDSFDAATCEIINMPLAIDDGCDLTTDSLDAVNCMVISIPPSCDDGNPDTFDSFDAANCACVNSTAGCQLSIPLAQGWDMVSSYCIPENDSIAAIFRDISSDVIQVKNLNYFYIPSLNINTFEVGGIHNGWDITQGYQVKTNNATTLVIDGLEEVDPSSNTIPLNAGWNIIAYWLQGNAMPADVLSLIASDVIQIKDLSSFYIPAIPTGNLVMQETKGYQIKMANANTLQYDPSHAARPAPEDVVEETVSPSHFVRSGMPHPNNAIVVVMEPEAGVVNYGDEVGVFNAEGLLVGSTVYQGGNIGLMIYGDDDTEEGIDGMMVGEPLILKVWDKLAQEERVLDVVFMEGPAHYEKDALSVGELKSVNTGMNTLDELGINAIPNPVSNQLVFELNLATTSKASSVQVYQLDGKLLDEIDLGALSQEGKHQIPYNVQHLNNGVYFYKLIVNGETIASNRFTVVR